MAENEAQASSSLPSLGTASSSSAMIAPSNSVGDVPHTVHPAEQPAHAPASTSNTRARPATRGRGKGRTSQADNEGGKDSDSGEDDEGEEEDSDGEDLGSESGRQGSGGVGSNGSYGAGGVASDTLPGGTKFISENEALREEANKLDANEKKGGRRKINIEFIDNKSRRHVTFSKRKAGLIKKAYELSTLTGTQVLLLVASETGNVYTFATPKLQPLITKPEGKSLIQSCLNPAENSSTSSSSASSQPQQSQAQQAAQAAAAAQDRHKMAALMEQRNAAVAAAAAQQQSAQGKAPGYPQGLSDIPTLNSLYGSNAAQMLQTQQAQILYGGLGMNPMGGIPNTLQYLNAAGRGLPPPFPTLSNFPSFPAHTSGTQQSLSNPYFAPQYAPQNFNSGNENQPPHENQ